MTNVISMRGVRHTSAILLIVTALVAGGIAAGVGAFSHSAAASDLRTGSGAWSPLGSGSNGTINSSIRAGFNAFKIPSGDAIWFAAMLQLTGPTPNASDLDAQGLHIHFVHQTLTFSESGGVTFTKYLPDGLVVFSKTATNATTVWDATKDQWTTTVPLKYTGDVFLSGYAYYVGSSGVPGSTHVTWSGQFLSSECAFQFNWKWAAAVYTSFAGTQAAPNYPGIGVKPVDDNKLSTYQNSDHAGTPEKFKADLAQGAMGGGGSNYTGSYSATAAVKKPFVGGCVST